MDGIIKGTKYADGIKQWWYIKREDDASPTVSVDDIIITSSIYSHEGSNVDTINILGSYLHIEAYEEFIIVLKAILIDILVNMDLKLYSKEGSEIEICETTKVVIWVITQCTSILLKN